MTTTMMALEPDFWHSMAGASAPCGCMPLWGWC